MDKIEKIRKKINELQDEFISIQPKDCSLKLIKSYAGYRYLDKVLSFIDSIEKESAEDEYDNTRVDLSKFDEDIREYGEVFCEDKPKPYWDGVYEALKDMREWGKLPKDFYAEPDKSLEEEMDKFFETMPVLEHENIFEETYHMIARHFAEWGAKNAK